MKTPYICLGCSLNLGQVVYLCNNATTERDCFSDIHEAMDEFEPPFGRYVQPIDFSDASTEASGSE